MTSGQILHHETKKRLQTIRWGGGGGGVKGIFLGKWKLH